MTSIEDSYASLRRLVNASYVIGASKKRCEKRMVSLTQLRFGKELGQLKLCDIESLIEKRIDESQSLEYKEPTSNIEKDCDDIAKAISGFLNTEGGIIVYGVSEKRESEHRYPSDIRSCNASKEQFESLLLNKVQPWEERILIHRIPNGEDDHKGIFVVEIPKSENRRICSTSRTTTVLISVPNPCLIKM